MPYLGNFGLKFENTIVIFEVSALKYVLLRSLMVQKENFLNLGPKYLMWVFLGQNFKRLLPYLKSTSSNLCNCKALCKNKISSIWDQKCHIRVF